MQIFRPIIVILTGTLAVASSLPGVATPTDPGQSAAPAWVTVLDLDALSKSGNANWFWTGATCDEPAGKRCMLALSDGGVPYLYFEVIEGGHSSSATPIEHAQMAAREYTYILRRLEH